MQEIYFYRMNILSIHVNYMQHFFIPDNFLSFII